MPEPVTLALVSHTNVGKTTLARTLLGRDIGEVRDAPHVTAAIAVHELAVTAEGDRLLLADTPGFGDSARLLERLRLRGRPLGRLLGWLRGPAWDRWRDRPFWASQQALHDLKAASDAVLYLVNAADPPAAAAHLAGEMAVLDWVGRPVVVLLNQLGAPRAPADEAAEIAGWRLALRRWPQVRTVLPLDAFARCWVQEATLWAAVQQALTEGAGSPRAAAMARLAAAWQAEREAVFGAAMQVLAETLAQASAARQLLDEDEGWAARWAGAFRRLGLTPSGPQDRRPAALAEARLGESLQEGLRDATAQLLRLHGLQGAAEAEIGARVASQFARRERVHEGRAAVIGGAITGALAGLKADIATGGLTLGGGLLAGGLLGALGAAGAARAVNLVRGTGRSWVAFSDAALDAAVAAALLRYLAVAHFGRGRGDWVAGEAPAHWPRTVDEALAPQRQALAALWRQRSRRLEVEDDLAQAATALRPIVEQAGREALHRLYPQAAARPAIPAAG